MVRVIPARDPTPATLGECVEALATWGFDPREEESLSHSANWLRRLGNDPHFLGDALVDLLAGRERPAAGAPAFRGWGPNSLLLAGPDRGNFAIGAEILPSPAEHALRASGARALGYGVVHNHNFDFLTLGYFGPGCRIDDYEFDVENSASHSGAAVMLRPVGRSQHMPGRLVHYRARCDVHCQHPPEALSVSLTLCHVHGAQGWTDHHTFEPIDGSVGGFRIASVLGHGPSETFLRLAVALGSEEAGELARHFGKHHPSDRMRLVAWRALAGAASDSGARDAVWREAEAAGSRRVAKAAKRRR
ncbi:hypothetical protein [Novosphingobium malaysiense]|uniref:Transposase n=1 Tax=Novosphingobium malaysiense TaxID=1348853 RepID=A0A0B1ZJ59_9SPHN|nr:hypothetical protein [Novosphingobium malaysiense]KHK89392.1 transposase [Novosphingobium malaysiense]